MSDQADPRHTSWDSEQPFRSLVETTSDWVWAVGRDGRYTYVSPKIKDLLGYEPEEVLGCEPFEFMPPEEADRARQLGVDMPITQAVVDVLEGRLLPRVAMAQLMARQSRAEA